MSIRESIFESFQRMSKEEQIAEIQKFKNLQASGGLPIHFREDDLFIMESVVNNENLSIYCENGICKLIASEIPEQINENDKIEESEELIQEKKEPERMMITVIKKLQKSHDESYNSFSKKCKENANILIADLGPTQIKFINDLLSEEPYARSLLNINEKNGVGRGEIFLQEVFYEAGKTAEVQGPSQSYDLKIGSRKYEVKCYAESKPNIRLGKEGKVSNFDEYFQLSDLMIKLRDFYNLIEYGELKNRYFKTILSMISSASEKLEDKQEDLLDKILKGVKDKDIKNVLDSYTSGEFPKKNIVAMGEIIEYTKELFQMVSANNFQYAKLFDKKKNKLYIMDEADWGKIIDDSDGNIKLEVQLSEIKEEDEKKIIDLMDAIIKHKAMVTIFGTSKVNGKKLIEDFFDKMVNSINENFRKHPMILFVDYKKDPKISGIYTEFAFGTFTQSAIKIKAIK